MEYLLDQPVQIQCVILIGIFLAMQLFYFLVLFVRIAFQGKKPADATPDAVSVIVCARNEERHLMELIPELMDQDHPQFEVVVVDDSSWDDTPDILRAYGIRYPNLKVVTLDDDTQRMSGKKFAVTMGIKAASHERLLFTDADCRPASTNWLSKMTALMNENKRVTIGYSPYRKQPGVLNHLIRYDGFFTGLQYLSFAKAGMPYMGVGRNLAYDRALFLNNGGFKSHMHISSGDDDLFVNEVARKNNTAVVTDPEAFSWSEAKTDWKSWWTQKRRHLTTGSRYRWWQKALLATYPMSWVGFHAALVLALVFHTPPVWIIGAWVLRSGLQIAIFSQAGKKLGDKRVALLAPLSEAFVLLYTPVVMTANLIQPPRQWK